VLELLHIDTYQKATGFISFLQNNPDILLNPTNISNIRIQDIEKIDITGSGNNTLILNLNDVLDASTSHIDTYQKATGFISFLQNNPDILLNPKRSIGISVGTTMSINIIGVKTLLSSMPAISLH
jgi:hypothetical protein